MLNFGVVKSIAILANPANNNEIEILEKVVKLFQNYNKQCFLFIFIDKQLKNDIFIKNKDWAGIGKENCNWLGKPRKDVNLNRFITQEFDLIVDFSTSRNFSLDYIFIHSKAHLKVMPTNLFSKQFADLMIEATNKNDKLAFAKELIHYLEIINKNQK